MTTANGVSYLSEIIRRLMRDKLVSSSASINEQLKLIRPIFKKQLKHLKAMSRPIDDWILDNIIQPLQDRKLLSIPEAINTLSDNFDVYSSSPKFLTDWRWYKEIIGTDRHFNEIALDCYFKNNINLLDYRSNHQSHSVEYGKRFELLCSKSWELMCEIENGNENKWEDLYKLLDEIACCVKSSSPETVKALTEANYWLQGKESFAVDMLHFPMWWGRGQQYLSFIRKA